MDDRQTKIREGAGLEDSRVNQEFLDFLNKWSSPVLIVLAVAALVWVGLQRLEQMRNAKIDQAFGELEAATAGTNPSPTSLTTIADEYRGVRAVPELAKLSAADLYLRAFMVGIEPGAQFDQITRTVSNPDDILDDDRRNQYLALAESSARSVLDASEGKPGKTIFAMQALTRLAAVEEGKRNFDGAKAYYERLKTISEQEMYASIGIFAENRIANLEKLKAIGPLPTREQVPSLPGDVSAITQEQLDAMIEQARQQAESQAPFGDSELPGETESQVLPPESGAPGSDDPMSSDNP